MDDELRKKIEDGSIYDKNYFDPDGEQEVSGYSSYEDYGWYKHQANRLCNTFGSKNILDVGCAKGFIVKYLRKHNRDARGIDISNYAISEAPGFVQPFVQCLRIDSHKFKSEDEYGLVISIETLEHVWDLDTALENIYKALTNPGFFWITVPFKDSPNADKDVTHINKYSKSEWVKKIESFGFKHRDDIKVGVGPNSIMTELCFIKQESKDINE